MLGGGEDRLLRTVREARMLWRAEGSAFKRLRLQVVMKQSPLTGADAPATTLQPGDPPIVCHLNVLDATQRERKKELLGIVRGKVQETIELPNGFALRMPADPKTFLELAEWVSLERRCCGFAAFALETRQDDTVWVTLTGKPGSKEVLAAEMGLEVSR